MKPTVNLIMPMAGRGSRFAGFDAPKPMIPLAQRPFFWWAIESIKRAFTIERLVCVTLAEHAIDDSIRRYYPDANIIVLPDITNGALETALHGLSACDGALPVLINDCDHAFDATALAKAASAKPLPSGILSHFTSASPHYSYAEYDAKGQLIRTAEKQLISDRAIAGAYWLQSPDMLTRYADSYSKQCPYNEWFVSGIYTLMANAHEPVQGVVLSDHIAFGTPDEYATAKTAIQRFSHWL